MNDFKARRDQLNVTFRNFVKQAIELHALLTKDEAKSKTCATSISICQQVVCEHYNVELPSLLSHIRLSRLCRPRHVAMALAVKLSGQPLGQIAIAFNREHHTTILHAVSVVRAREVTEPDFPAEYAALQAEVERRIHNAEMPLFPLPKAVSQ